MKHVCAFIAHEFDDLTELWVFVDDRNSAPRVKPSAMKILFHDEKYTDENMLIPRAYQAAKGGERACNVNSPRVDGEILNVTKNNASTHHVNTSA